MNKLAVARAAIPLAEFAIRISLSYDSAFRAYQSGRLKGFRAGRKILIPTSELERVLAEGLEIPRGRPPKPTTDQS